MLCCSWQSCSQGWLRPLHVPFICLRLLLKRLWESMRGKRRPREDLANDYPCRLKRQEAQMALLIQEAAEGTSCVSLSYSAQSTSSCCFGPPQPQTVQPKLDTVSRPRVPKPYKYRALRPVLLTPFSLEMLQMPWQLTAWIWHIHLNCGERHRHEGFNHLPTRQDLLWS